LKVAVAAPWPFWIAHRGAGKLAPENTLAAFREGARHGYRAFECDVKLSADGVPFLLHDASLERTTSGHGIAAERAWAELSRMDAGSWHSPAFAGEPPASLEGIAAFCRAGGHTLNIEIKPTPGTDTLTGQAVAMAAQRLWAGSVPPPLLSSFRVGALEAAKAAAPALPRALLIDSLWAGWLEAALQLGPHRADPPRGHGRPGLHRE
jgi:glycerophosphoryl diester phosphodiesterase